VGKQFLTMPVAKPTEMSDKALIEFINSGSIKIAVLCETFRPYYLELRDRFAKKPKGETIEGFSSWNDYCEQTLDRTRRAVNYFLSGGNAEYVAKRREANKPNDLAALDARYKTLDARLRKTNSHKTAKGIIATMRDVSAQRDALLAVSNSPATTVHVAYADEIDTSSPKAIVGTELSQLVSPPDLARVGEPFAPPISESTDISVERRATQCFAWIRTVLTYLHGYEKERLYDLLIFRLTEERAAFREQMEKPTDCSARPVEEDVQA
jgi:hypothetical protein